jgi:protein phosphatase
VVAIYRGPAEPLFGIDLSHQVETSDVVVTELPEFEQEQVGSNIIASSLDDAHAIIDRLRAQAAQCSDKNPPAGCP